MSHNSTNILKKIAAASSIMRNPMVAIIVLLGIAEIWVLSVEYYEWTTYVFTALLVLYISIAIFGRYAYRDTN